MTRDSVGIERRVSIAAALTAAIWPFDLPGYPHFARNRDVLASSRDHQAGPSFDPFDDCQLSPLADFFLFLRAFYRAVAEKKNNHSES